MEHDKLIEALRTESRYKDKATLEIMDLCMMAADKLEELNSFEQSQCAKLLAQLAEKDKQLAAAAKETVVWHDADEAPMKSGDGIKTFAIAIEHVNGGEVIMASTEYRYGEWDLSNAYNLLAWAEIPKWRGPQEAGEGGG